MSELILSLLSKYSWQENPVWLLEFEQTLEGTKDDLNEQAFCSFASTRSPPASSLHRAANTLPAAQERNHVQIMSLTMLITFLRRWRVCADRAVRTGFWKRYQHALGMVNNYAHKKTSCMSLDVVIFHEP